MHTRSPSPRHGRHSRRRSRERHHVRYRSRSLSRGRGRSGSADRDFRPNRHWSPSRIRHSRSPPRGPCHSPPRSRYGSRGLSPFWGPGAGGEPRWHDREPADYQPLADHAAQGTTAAWMPEGDLALRNGYPPPGHDNYHLPHYNGHAAPHWLHASAHDRDLPYRPEDVPFQIDDVPFRPEDVPFDFQDKWVREGSMGRGRGSDTDRDWDVDREIEWARRLKEQEMPTSSIFIKGLPEAAEEADIHRLFEAYPNIQSVKLLRDRFTGRRRGMAFVDFASVDDARVLMESDVRWTLNIGGARLLLDYSHGTPGGRGSQPGEAGAPQGQDWICDMCNAVNFARRLECYHCYTARPAHPRRVTADLNEPSNILKVSGLEPDTSEEGLFQFLAAVVPNIVDLRVIKDKYTGAPRGFAFVELGSVPEAGTLMVACQGQTLPGQSTPLKICYAKAKEQLLGSAYTDDGTGSGRVAARAIHETVGVPQWKPKEFDASAVLESKEGGSGNTAHDQAAANGSSAGAANHMQQALLHHQQHSIATSATQHIVQSAATGQAQGPAAGQGPSSEATAASAAGVDAATIQALTQAGYQYQPLSGYWFDEKSGYYYDAKTSLYYHHSTNQWYQYNADTGQYTAVGGNEQQQQSTQQPAAALQAPNGAMQQQQQQQQHEPQQYYQPEQQQQKNNLQQLHQQEQQQYQLQQHLLYQQPQHWPQQQQQPQPQAQQQQTQQRGQQQQRPMAPADKRRRAVIGSAPQYNPEGLMAAAALAKERAEEQKRLAAAKAARERQQQQQNKAVQKQQQQLMPGKPGIGALPGTATAPPQPAQVVAEGNVQGVVYRSKWAQRAAQQGR